MNDSGLLAAAIPFFMAALLAEMLALRGYLARRGGAGYATRDTWASLAMGLGSVVLGAATAPLLALAAGAVGGDPLVQVGHGVAGWAVAIVGVDLLYYLDHRLSHRVRLLWAGHVVHHSSRYFNLSTALRQEWTGPFKTPIFFPVLLLGVSPTMMAVAYSVNLIYQFWIHTEAIDRLPRPVEAVFNTPSHHRVHHGSNRAYIDRNYGGILILWDRWFKTFAPEAEPVVYGLTTNIGSHHPLRIVSHEWIAMGRDLRRARSWRHRAGYVLAGPGWTPATAAA